MQDSRVSTGFKSPNPKTPTYYLLLCYYYCNLCLNDWFYLVFSRKFKAASGTVSYPHIIRPRSINGLADQGAAALTDGQYIERLQLALQQASVSSLQERLAERKVQSVMQLPVINQKSIDMF